MRSVGQSGASPAWMDALGHRAADRRIDILRGIGRSGSISQAAREAGVSYKAAWQAVATLTNLAGVPLVLGAPGGAHGGGAQLTAEGRQLLVLAEACDRARQQALQQASETGGAAAVTRLAIRTSMRNQLPARIDRIETTGRMAQVSLALGALPQRVIARVTQESVELLALAEGLPALALCKATAVRVELPCAPPRTPARASHNRLAGVVSAVSRGDDGDEIGLTLEGTQLELVGFAAPGTALRRRQRVVARVDASAVVVALPG